MSKFHNFNFKLKDQSRLNFTPEYYFLYNENDREKCQFAFKYDTSITDRWLMGTSFLKSYLTIYDMTR